MMQARHEEKAPVPLIACGYFGAFWVWLVDGVT